MEAFSASAWQDKVAAYTAVEEFVANNDGPLPRETVDAIFSFVAAKSRGYKDSNFNLANATLAIVQALAGNGPNFTPGHAVVVIEAIAPKFGARKVDANVVATMEAFCQHFDGGPRIVVGAIPGALAKTRSPVALAACFDYLALVVDTRGAINVDCQAILAFLNGAGPAAGLKSSNRTVAPKARAVLATIYNQLGPKFENYVKSQVSDAALMKALEADFAAKGFDAAKAQQFKQAAAAAAGGGGGAAAAGAGDLEVPRADLVSMLPTNINKQLNDTSTKTAWQVRSKALGQVAKTITAANNCIVLNKASADLLRILNERCTESNVNVKRVALTTTGAFLSSIEPAKRAKIGRLIVEGLMQSFADKKDAVRQSAVDAMKAFVADEDAGPGQLSAACFLQCFKSMSVVFAMPAFRATTLQWLQFCLESPAIVELRTQLVPLVPSLIACMCDRTSSVRSVAESILATIYGAAPKKAESAIRKVVQDLKPAEQRAVQAAIAKIKASGAANSTSKTSAKGGGSGGKKAAAAAADRPGAARGKRLPAPGARSVDRSAAAGGGGGAVGASKGGAGGGGGEEEDTRVLVECPARDRNRREKKYLKNKWIWDVSGAPRADFVAALRVDFEHYFNVGTGPEVVKLLFSAKDTDHCVGVKKLSACVRDFPRELMSVTDLVVKWVSYRMCLRDNTKAIQAMQTFVQRFFQMLINHSYEMADFEAQALLPFLCEKVGHRSDRFRTSYRAIMAQLRELYPVAKMAPFFIEALHSKSAKTHSECLEELGIMIRAAGNWKICGRRGIRSITERVGSSDVSTRTAAIGILYFVWKQFDFDWEDLKRVVGELSPKVLSLMQEKFRTLKAQDKGTKAGAMAGGSKIIATPNTIRGGGGRKAAAAAAAAGAAPNGAGGAADDDEFGSVFTLDVVTLSPSRAGDQGFAAAAASAATPAPGLSTKSMSFTAEKPRVLQPSSMLGVALDHIGQLAPAYGAVEAGARIEIADPSAHSRAVTAIKAMIDLAQIALGEPTDNADTLDFEQTDVVDVIRQQQAAIMDTLLGCVQAAGASPGVLDFRVLSLNLSVLMKLFGLPAFAEQTSTGQASRWLGLMVQLLTSPKIDVRNKTDDALCRAVNYLTAKMVDEAPLSSSMCAAYVLLATEDDTATTTTHSILLKHLEKIFKREDARGPAAAYDAVDVGALFRDMAEATPAQFANSIVQDVARTICRNLLAVRPDAVTAALPALGVTSAVGQTVRQLQQEIQSAVKRIDDAEYAEQVSSIVAAMLARDATPVDRKQGVAQLHQLQVDFPDRSVPDALPATGATEPFQNFIRGELATLAEAEASRATNVVHQGSLSLQSRLARMKQKYQISTGTGNGGGGGSEGLGNRQGATPPTARDAKENGALNANHEQRQQKATKMMNQTRDSLNKMRARLQKLKIGATPARPRQPNSNDDSSSASAAAAAAADAAGAGADDAGDRSASKPTVSNLRDRLKMWQAKHAS